MQADDGRWDKDLASHMQLHKDQPVGIVKSFDAQPEFHFHGSCCRQGGRVLEQNEAARGSVLQIMPRDTRKHNLKAEYPNKCKRI